MRYTILQFEVVKIVILLIHSRSFSSLTTWRGLSNPVAWTLFDRATYLAPPLADRKTLNVSLVSHVTLPLSIVRNKGTIRMAHCGGVPYGAAAMEMIGGGIGGADLSLYAAIT